MEIPVRRSHRRGQARRCLSAASSAAPSSMRAPPHGDFHLAPGPFGSFRPTKRTPAIPRKERNQFHKKEQEQDKKLQSRVLQLPLYVRPLAERPLCALRALCERNKNPRERNPPSARPAKKIKAWPHGQAFPKPFLPEIPVLIPAARGQNGTRRRIIQLPI